jgi:hypothetical protein
MVASIRYSTIKKEEVTLIEYPAIWATTSTFVSIV